MNELQENEVPSGKNVSNVEILKPSVSVKKEARDDSSTAVRPEEAENREVGDQSSNRPQVKARKNKKATNPSQQIQGYGAFQQPGRQYHPRGQIPPPYYPGGSHHEHYRGPPPPHYHQMPPLPHPGQQGAYSGAPGHYPPNLAARPGPPPGYPHAYGAGYPGPMPMGYHGAPPPYPQAKAHLMSQSSDSNSMTSSKSRSIASRKKRPIEGVHSTKEKTGPVAYTFGRTNSSMSSSTIATAPTSTESHTMGDESPYKRERTTSPSSVKRQTLTSTNIFEDEQFIPRNYSNASTTSSVTVGGISMSSHDRARRKFDFIVFLFHCHSTLLTQ